MIAFLLAGARLDAGEYRIVPEQSVFAIVTHRGGLAGGAAHNHFITASNYTARLAFDTSEPLATEFEIRFAVEDLVVDSAELRRKWYPRLEALGILDEPFKDLSDDDRQKIRQTMLDKNQLDSTAFPSISARIEDAVAEPSKKGDVETPYRVTLRLEVHGRSVEAPVSARYEFAEEVLRIEATGMFRFRDFGIKPYSAMLGMVKNKNEFHVYVHLVAVPAGE
jgi:hypothetical protein